MCTRPGDIAWLLRWSRCVAQRKPQLTSVAVGAVQACTSFLTLLYLSRSSLRGLFAREFWLCTLGERYSVTVVSFLPLLVSEMEDRKDGLRWPVIVGPRKEP